MAGRAWRHVSDLFFKTLTEEERTQLDSTRVAGFAAAKKGRKEGGNWQQQASECHSCVSSALAADGRTRTDGVGRDGLLIVP